MLMCMLYEIKTDSKTDIVIPRNPSLYSPQLAPKVTCEGNKTHSWKRNMRVGCGQVYDIKAIAMAHYNTVYPHCS